MSEVSLKFFMPMKIASMEKKGPHAEIGKALDQISQSLKEKKVKISGDALGLLHGDPKGADFQQAHYEVCIPISGKIKGEGEVKARELEKGAFACVTHTGPLDKLPDAYKVILKWVEENGYMISGATREVFLKGVGETGGGSREVVIEVQFPVRK